MMKSKHSDLRNLLTKALVAIDNENSEAKDLISECIDVVDKNNISHTFKGTEDFAKEYGEPLQGISDSISTKMGLQNMILVSTPKGSEKTNNITVGSMETERLESHM